MKKLTDEQLKVVKADVIEDEKEYCFDRNYCPDEHWEKERPTQTREQAFNEVVNWIETLTLEELINYYGDRYDYIINTF